MELGTVNSRLWDCYSEVDGNWLELEGEKPEAPSVFFGGVDWWPVSVYEHYMMLGSPITEAIYRSVGVTWRG